MQGRTAGGLASEISSEPMPLMNGSRLLLPTYQTTSALFPLIVNCFKIGGKEMWESVQSFDLRVKDSRSERRTPCWDRGRTAWRLAIDGSAGGACGLRASERLTRA